MPALDRWITNLESDDFISKEVAQASQVAADAKNDHEVRRAAGILAHAQARLLGHQNTQALLKAEFGDYVVGLPRKTRFKAQSVLMQQGYVGIYRSKDA